MIQINRSSIDNRKKEIILTEKGRLFWKSMKVCITDIERSAMQGISKEEEAVFISVLERICQNLKNG